MKKFSRSYKRIGTESAFAVGPEISSWEKKGYDIVRLNIGEPGADIAPFATKAAINSFKKHETHYTPSKGRESLREKIANYMSKTRGVNYDKEDIVLTPGGKPVIGGTIFILVNPEDEVIYPTPGYPIYESIVDFIGARKVPIQLKEEKGFRFCITDLEKKVSKRTKLLILNSPSNPTGGVLEKQDYKKIAKLAKKYDFYILADEIYSRIAFGKNLRQVSYLGNKLPLTDSIIQEPGMLERTVLLDGFSKTYAMTGLRLGFACSKIPGFMPEFLTYAINFWSSIPDPLMSAAEAVLGRDQKHAQKEIKGYEEKKTIAVRQLNKIEGITCHDPKGSFYLFPNVTKACKKLGLKDSEEFRKYLLSFDKKNKKGVAVLSRIHFGKRLPQEREEYIRLSVAGEVSAVREGVKRIKQALQQ